jgi:Fe-S oxidoreductase
MISLARSDNHKLIFAPGCALMLYKPGLAARIHKELNKYLGDMDVLDVCCQHDPQLKPGTVIINVCPGCDKRFRNDYKDISTISLWEVLAEGNFFEFPDYHGRRMSILDACPTREQEGVQNAIRTILIKMNIELVEPKNTRGKSICCGDGFYGEIPTDKVKELMIKRASEMPVNEVVVYCISCIKSVFIGGKESQYLIDLLFEELTFPKTLDPDAWHKELSDYIEVH